MGRWVNQELDFEIDWIDAASVIFMLIVLVGAGRALASAFALDLPAEAAGVFAIAVPLLRRRFIGPPRAYRTDRSGLLVFATAVVLMLGLLGLLIAGLQLWNRAPWLVPAAIGGACLGVGILLDRGLREPA